MHSPIRLEPHLVDRLRELLDGSNDPRDTAILAVLPPPRTKQYPTKEQVKLIGKWFAQSRHLRLKSSPLTREDIEVWAAKFLSERTAAHLIVYAEKANDDDTSESAHFAYVFASHHSLELVRMEKENAPFVAHMTKSVEPLDTMASSKDSTIDEPRVWPTFKAKSWPRKS